MNKVSITRRLLSFGVIVTLACHSSGASAGGFFGWFKRGGGGCDRCNTTGVGCATPCNCRCCDEGDDDHDRHCFLGSQAAPFGAVVSAIPAVMVAQPAVAVSTQRLEASLAEDVGDAREDRLMRTLLERLSARMESSQAAAAAQAASAERVDPAQLQRLKEQLDALQRAIESIPVPPTQGR